MKLLATLATRYPRWVIAFWLVIAGIGLGLASQLHGRLLNGGYDVAGSGAQQAKLAIEKAFPGEGEAQSAITVKAPAGGPKALATSTAATVAAAKGSGVVDAVGVPRVSKDGTLALVPVQLEGTIGESQRSAAKLQKKLDDLPGTQVVVGQAGVYDRYQTHSKGTLANAAIYSAPLILLVLAAAFMSSAALLPLLLSAVSLAGSFGVLYVLSHIIDLSVFAVDTALVLGLGLSVDFSLFMVMRLRETRGDGDPDPEREIPIILRTTGRAIAVSGLTVVVSLCGLFVVGVGILSSLALGAIASVVVVVLAALTLAPAVLVVGGRAVDRMPARVTSATVKSRFRWRRIATRVVNYKYWVIGVAFPLLLMLSVLAVNVQISMQTFSALPKDDPVRNASADVSRAFGPGVLAPAVVMTRAPAEAAAAAAGVPGVALAGQPQQGRDGWSRLTAIVNAPPDSDRAADTLRDLRQTLDAEVSAPTFVGGPIALSIDLSDRITERTWLAILAIALGEFILLAVMFRAPIVAAKTTLAGLLTVGATLGILRLIFGLDDPLAFFVPLTLIAVVFGLSTDYAVILLSRIQEEYLGGRDSTESIKRGLMETGRSLTLAGLLMSAVYFAFSLSVLDHFTQLGLGMGIAVLLDVTVVRVLLVPATMAMLKDANWWTPSFVTARARKPVESSSTG